MKKINDFSVNLRGPMMPDYYDGCGVTFTDWEDVFSGTGFTTDEAVEDALDCAAESDWDTSTIDEEVGTYIGEDQNVCVALSCEFKNEDDEPGDHQVCQDCESVFFVELYVK